MSSTGDNLSEYDISQLTDLVSADNRLRFCTEYLGTDRNEYKTIEADAKYFHHDTLFECIRRWRNKTEAEGNNVKDELIRILSSIRRERGWFSQQHMAFLQDVTAVSEASKRVFINFNVRNPQIAKGDGH